MIHFLNFKVNYPFHKNRFIPVALIKAKKQRVENAFFFQLLEHV